MNTKNKKRTIKVNKICEINRDNIALSVENRRIAINVIQKVKDEKGFINYCLAVDDEQICCEEISAGYRKLVDFDENNVYISKIVSNIIEEESYHSLSYICKIYGKAKKTDFFNKLIAIGFVNNTANAGWYSHIVYESENGKIVYETEL